MERMKVSRRIALVLLAIGAIWLFRALTGPTTLRTHTQSAVDQAHVVFSSLESQSPEQIGQKFLEQLKRGECGTGVTAAARDYCSREQKYKLSGWSLIDRHINQDGSVSLQYKVFRDGYDNGAWGNLWLTLNQSRGQWYTTNFETYY